MLQLNDRSGTKRPLWLVDSEYKIGAQEGSALKIDAPGVAPHEASLTVSGETVSLVPKSGSEQIKVNGKVVTESVVLTHGDAISISNLTFDLVDPKKRPAPPVSAIKKTSHLWRLIPLNSALSGREFNIEATVILGRSKECDITLGVSHLSRRHAELRVMPSGLEVIDLNSSNGTYVNGKKVAKALLKAGDELSFDTLRFKVAAPEQPPKPSVSQEDDLDRTTMRPAITSEEMERLAGEPGYTSPKAHSETPRVKRAIDKPLKASRPDEKSQAAESSEESSSNSRYIAMVVACFALLGAVWFFFLR